MRGTEIHLAKSQNHRLSSTLKTVFWSSSDEEDQNEELCLGRTNSIVVRNARCYASFAPSGLNRISH